MLRTGIEIAEGVCRQRRPLRRAFSISASRHGLVFINPADGLWLTFFSRSEIGSFETGNRLASLVSHNDIEQNLSRRHLQRGSDRWRSSSALRGLLVAVIGGGACGTCAPKLLQNQGNKKPRKLKQAKMWDRLLP